MRIFILPGYSQKNRAWAEELKYNMQLPIPTEIISWKHWETGNASDFDPVKEANKLSEKIDSSEEEIYIIAKSIGTLVASYVLRAHPFLITKIIYCGIPLHDLSQNDREVYDVLGDIPNYKLHIYQNSEDPHGSSDEVTAFLKSINPQLTVIKRILDTHDYPYYSEFKKIFSSIPIV